MQNGSTLTITSASNYQTAGLTQADGVLNLVNAPLALNGGTLKGSGTINGNVVNTNGTVSPGDSPGTLAINGNYTQGSNGVLNIEFTNSAHDLLTVTGNTTLDGVLNVNYIDPAAYTGGVGSKFAFLDYTTLTAANSNGLFFANELANGTIAGTNGFDYQLINDTAKSQLDLEITQVGKSPVPEASTTVSFGVLLALGLGGLIVSAKRRKASSL